MKKSSPSSRPVTPRREQLNLLMEAVALVIARRQMKRYWITGHRATLPSII